MTDISWSRALSFVEDSSKADKIVSTTCVGASMDPQKRARVRQSSVVAIARHAWTQLLDSLGLGHLVCDTYDMDSAAALVEQCYLLLEELTLSREAYAGEYFSCI